MADNVLGVLFQNIADAIRAKTGGTETMKPNEFPTQIANIPVGGGSSADVRYVTFIGADGTVLYKKAVAVGDDCVDVAAKGLISTPTKEGDVYYTYHFAGWSLSAGEEADETALKNVTEDKTVYAAFDKETVYYTVNFYDDDGVTLLSSVQVAYGADASYVPQKTGYTFVSWSADVSNVTGNMDVVAVWEIDDGYIHDSWETVVARCLDGTASTYYPLGRKIALPLEYADGTTEMVDMCLATYGESGGKLADGSAIHATFAAVNALAESKGVLTSGMSTGTAWKDTTIIKYLEDTVLPAMPTILQQSIKQRTISSASFALWLPQAAETYNASMTIWTEVIKLGIAYGTNLNGTTKTLKPMYKTNGNVTDWWLQERAYSSGQYYCRFVETGGAIRESRDSQTTAMTTPRGVVFGFCI